MKIAVLCIATNFKIRIKVGNKSYLKQEDIKTVASYFAEISLWLKNSNEELIPIIVTCYDEIYEMAIQRHFVCFKNEFGSISEGNMIRFGISSYPGADAYFVVSTSEKRLFRAEIFEMICDYMHANPNKLIISNFENKFVLPMIFTNKLFDPLRSIVDRENGKFVLKSNTKNAIYLTITDDLLNLNNFHTKEENNSELDFSTINKGDDTKCKIEPVIIIRGGGRLASSIAISLHRFGFRVIITEKHTPSTLFRGLAFATAVYSTDIEIDGVKAFLVSPSQKQIKKAWDINAIPVVIDPNLEILELFDPSNIKESIITELSKSKGVDIISYLSKIHESDNNVSRASINTMPDSVGDYDTNKFSKNSPIFALIDATSGITQTRTNRKMAPITIGVRNDLEPGEDVNVKIYTKPDSQYGKIIFNKDFNIARIHSETQQKNKDESIITHGKNECESYNLQDISKSESFPDIGYDTKETFRNDYFAEGNLIYVCTNKSGVFRSNHKIGDEIEEGSQIGQIEDTSGDYSKVLSPVKGRLIGNAITNMPYKENEIVAVIDISNVTKNDCFRTVPIDNCVTFSVLTLLKKDL